MDSLFEDFIMFVYLARYHMFTVLVLGDTSHTFTITPLFDVNLRDDSAF